jgi:putative transcriptional regulator
VKRKLFEELLESVKQANEIVRGERAPSREFYVDAAMIKQLRKRPYADTWSSLIA